MLKGACPPFGEVVAFAMNTIICPALIGPALAVLDAFTEKVFVLFESPFEFKHGDAGILHGSEDHLPGSTAFFHTAAALLYA